jgi:hypothetical protein
MNLSSAFSHRANILGLLLVSALVGADTDLVQQQTLKAAFICHFLNLTRWPEAGNSVVLGVYGNSRMGDDLAAVLPKTVGALSIRVIRLQPDAREWDSMNAIYIPRTYQAEVPEILKRLGTAPILTIGDSPRFAANGGIIGFVQEGGKLRFEVNQGAASKRNLQLSAKLLELAKSVER